MAKSIDNRLPEHAIKSYQDAIFFLQNGQAQESVPILYGLIKDYPKWGGPLYLICELILKDEIRSPTNKNYLFSRLKSRPFKSEAISLFLLAWAAENNNDFNLATSYIEECLEKDRNFSPAIQKLAVIKIRQEEWSEAELLLRQELNKTPGESHLLLNLSVALLRQNKLKDSLQIALKAQQSARSDQKQAIHVNLGSIYQELNKRQKALFHYNEAILINPNNINANLNLGVLALQQKDFSTAEDKFRKVLELNPNEDRASVNLAGVLLLQGRTREGWNHYEKRLHDNSKILDTPNLLPKWSGEKIKGSLVLVHEQGLGDSFQFIRYAQHLKTLNIRCHFRGPEKLHDVFNYSGLVNSCINEENSLPEDAEAWAPLMSLPRLLSLQNPEFTDIPVPYIKTNPELIDKWQSILGPKKGLRFALHWQGNPQHEFTISRGRSIALEELTPLLDLSNVEWISLQKGDGSEQAKSTQWKNRWHQKQDQINHAWGFDDAAAILTCCDGLISSDSGLAHLAGATGNRVLLMLPWLAEWRWGIQGQNSDWYPNHSLFRQTEEGKWSTVVENIMIKLKSIQ